MLRSRKRKILGKAMKWQAVQMPVRDTSILTADARRCAEHIKEL